MDGTAGRSTVLPGKKFNLPESRENHNSLDVDHRVTAKNVLTTRIAQHRKQKDKFLLR